MENIQVTLTPKQYYQLECLLRGNRDLSRRLTEDRPMNGRELLETILFEISDLEYDESGDTPLEYRMYDPGRRFLEVLTRQLYPDEPEKFVHLIGSADGLIRKGPRMNPVPYLYHGKSTAKQHRPFCPSLDKAKINKVFARPFSKGRVPRSASCFRRILET